MFFYCIYSPQNFVFKNLDNVLIKFFHTLLSSRQLWKVQVSLSDFRKTSRCQEIRTKVKAVMTALHCYGNSDFNIILDITTNCHLYLIQLWWSFFYKDTVLTATSLSSITSEISSRATLTQFGRVRSLGVKKPKRSGRSARVSLGLATTNNSQIWQIY